MSLVLNLRALVIFIELAPWPIQYIVSMSDFFFIWVFVPSAWNQKCVDWRLLFKEHDAKIVKKTNNIFGYEFFLL